MIRNKSGHIFTIWWFLILAVIGAGIVTGIGIFYSSNIDVRSLESDVLADKVIRCISDYNGINNEVLKENFDLYSNCSISRKFLIDDSKYFVRINVDNLFNDLHVITHRFGNNAFEKNCEIKKVILRANAYPECTEKEVFVLDKDGNKLLVKVLAASNARGVRENE